MIINQPTPLVSIIVRSMGRPELAQALASIARQDYLRIEVIVVDATGGSHPPLPDIAWQHGHVLRVVGGDRRLPRPLACNVGLDAVTGEWFGFLDDDDTYEPHHVSALVEAVQRHPHALVVYGRSRILGPDGRVEKLFGFPFNRALLYHMPLFYWQAALISQKVRVLGCRFDEALEICEDRDFLQQIAEHGDFAFVPVIGFNYRPDLGTSGTGTGANRNLARLLYFDSRLKAKWAGPSEYHTARAARGVRRAIEAYGCGDLETSRGLLEATLADYPDDPNAMHAMARLDFEAGQLAKAQDEVERAIELNPRAFEYCLTQALILERLADEHGARATAQRAMADPVFRAAALALLGRLAKSEPLPAAVPSAKPVSRNQPCPCGSGKRYKHCCGAAQTDVAAPATLSPVTVTDQRVTQAFERLQRGEASAARALLDSIKPSMLCLAERALEVAAVYRELDDAVREFAFLARATELGAGTQAGTLLERCTARLFQDTAWDSLRAQARKLLQNIHGRAARRGHDLRSGKGPIHIVNDFQGIGGSEHRALGLYRLFEAHAARVYLWATLKPLARFQDACPGMRVINSASGQMSEGGTVVLIGHYFDIASLAQTLARCERVVLIANVSGLGNMKRIVALLTELDEMQAGLRVDFAYPSRMWQARVGLGGQVEYPPIDTQHFSPPAASSRAPGTGMVVGRIARPSQTKFHPDEPHLIRSIVARGHAVRIMDGSPLHGALQAEVSAGRVQFVPRGAVAARDFLAGLDCFLYWKHPSLIETGGTAVLEAMSMGLPVIAFAKDLGVAELIEPGKDGFLVDTEAQALECLDRLAASPELRRALGMAAREKVLLTQLRQRQGMLDSYLGARKR